MAIVLTETAVSEARRILESQGHQGWGLRVAVKGGGCSGLSYSMTVEQEPRADDEVFEYGDVRVFCDPKSYLYLNGMTLDFSTELMGGGFKFINPNAKRTCGCGSSFAA